MRTLHDYMNAHHLGTDYEHDLLGGILAGEESVELIRVTSTVLSRVPPSPQGDVTEIHLLVILSLKVP